MMIRFLVLAATLLLSACKPEPPAPPQAMAPGANGGPGLAIDRISELISSLEQLQELLARIETPIAERRPAIQIAMAGVETFLNEGERFLPAPVMSEIETVLNQIDRSSATDEEIPGNIAKQLEEDLSALLEQLQGSNSESGPPIGLGPVGPGPMGPGPGGPRPPGPPGPP